jgi:hypothetical protein
MTEDQLTQILKRLEKLEHQYTDLESNLDLIDHKHENVMSSVLDHLVYQSNVLKDQVTLIQSISSECYNNPREKVCSAEYAQILNHEHTNGGWGQSAKKRYTQIVDFLSQQHATSILDYGAGSANRLSVMLNQDYPGVYSVTDYDPGIPDISQSPEPHQVVVCIDVLEHVEPELIDNVLDDLKRVTQQSGYFEISTQPALRTLINGKNAHLIVQPADWWIEKLSLRFNVVSTEEGQGNLTVVVTSK